MRPTALAVRSADFGSAWASCSRQLPTLSLAFLLIALLSPAPLKAQNPEFRAFWVDAFHAGFKNSSDVTTLLRNIRNANCNAVVVELRKRGDAYYTPNTSYVDYEPHATDTSPADFDSLADLISKAHDTSGGKQRIEVHVWLVTWPIWGSTNSYPANPQHPYNRHPEWLTQDNTGASWNGSQYCFDPGHPGAMEHTYRIAMNLVTNYDIDGINFDYIRYAGSTWGYNPVSVARFHARYGGGSDNPASTNTNWLQFRRDQVTALLRKVYLNTMAAKPSVKVSADTITWAPGPVSPPDWYGSGRPWNQVLQDWRGWMQEGILDLNIPMAYFDQSGAYAQDWTNWCNFIRDYQYNRHAAIGPGIYLNATADAIREMRFTRAASPSGHTARGVCGYSYAVPDKNSTPFATFLTYLTNAPTAYDPVSPAIFSQPASVPAMPWKTAPSAGHLMGTVFAGSTNSVADGAVVTVSGSAATRAQTNDGSGFFGFVDLPPGSYTVWATMPGLGPVTNSVSVTAGAVTNVILVLSTNDSLADIIIDNPAASVAGSWSTGTASADKYGADYRFKSQGTGTGYLEYTPRILVAGNYRIYEWHPAGSNRTTNAPYVIHFGGGTQTLSVSQKLNGGGWNLLGSFNFAAGSSGNVRITDGFTDAGQVVIADALKFVYVPPAVVPVITAQPQSLTVKATSNATFAVSVSGTAPLSYQWLFNGAPIAQATASAFSRVNVEAIDAGSYLAVVTNVAGSVTSNPAMLWVQPLEPPLILAQPQGRAAVPGGSASFSVAASSASPLHYQWRFNGTDIADELRDTISLPQVQIADFGTYTVLLSNDDGSVLSDPAVLSLARPPALAATLVAQSNFSLAFPTEPGPVYSLEYSGDLANPAWLVLTNLTGTGSPVLVTDVVSPDPGRFYRLHLH